MPVFDDNGTKTIYTREKGLSRLYLNRNLGLDSYDDDLADSNDDGRVVVVNPEGTQKFLNEYLINLQKIRDSEIEKINQKYKKAEDILRG
jgi:hypothetical protein